MSIGVVHDLPIFEAVSGDAARAALGRAFGDVRHDVVVYGDTHVEAIDEIDKILCVNPGSPTFPHHLELQYDTIGFIEIEHSRPAASIWRIDAGGITPFDWSTWRRPIGSRRREGRR